MTSMQYRLNSLRQRRTDPRTRRVVLGEAIAFEKLAKALPNTPAAAMTYIAEAMEPVDSEFTKRSFASARKVQELLVPALADVGHQVSFEHQGSVTNNTHIKFHSDIDLLVLTERFVTKQAPLKVNNLYQGDPVSELGELRELCHGLLVRTIAVQAIDAGGAKSLCVNPPAVECKVDVVPANWIDTVEYEITGDKARRGVYVFDQRAVKRIKNFPFLHNAEIDRRDTETGGSLRRLIRLVKSVRCDTANRPAVSSYDIASICYHMPNALYPDNGNEATLILNFIRFATDLAADPARRVNLYVPNRDRLLFGDNGLKVEPLIHLASELVEILTLMLGHQRRRR